jgi:3-dehydroquinate dehydratase-1
MREKKPDILKLATMVHSDEDNKTLIKLLLNKHAGEQIIVIGMGEKAIYTRSFNPLLGSFLTFASVGESSSAPGQLDIKTLKTIYSLLGYSI